MTMRSEFDDLSSWDPFSGDKDDVGVRARSVKIVKTRKPHQCLATEDVHTIPIGSLARREKAIFDGRWSVWYACIDCINREIEKDGGA